MDKQELDRLALAYIEHHSNRYVWDENLILNTRDNSLTEWVIHEVFDVVYESPDDLWELILEILRRDPPTEVMEILAAGPLEDYLVKYGNERIEQVEVHAGRDPKFRNLLGGVWRNSMSEEVWRRVQACWDRSGWDGNPVQLQ